MHDDKCDGKYQTKVIISLTELVRELKKLKI